MEITHCPEQHEFTVTVDGHRCYVNYRLTPDGGLDIRHTVVPGPVGGRGIASELVRTAYDYARSQGLACIATCAYAVVWLERHPEYAGKAGCDYGGPGCCAV